MLELDHRHAATLVRFDDAVAHPSAFGAAEITLVPVLAVRTRSERQCRGGEPPALREPAADREPRAARALAPAEPAVTAAADRRGGEDRR